MTAWEIIFGWNDGKYPPTKDGRYYVAKLHRSNGDITLDTFDYTVEYGWNTNQYAKDNAITFEGTDIFWTPALRLKVEEATK